VGIGQDPAITQTRNPDAGVTAPTRDGVTACGPQLDLGRALFRARLRESASAEQYCEENEKESFHVQVIS